MTNEGTPYIDSSGAIVIPSNADPKYHYWNGGQSLADTLRELNAPENVWRNHTEKPYPEKAVAVHAV
jgi:predicted amidohydrolase YtcJ